MGFDMKKENKIIIAVDGFSSTGKSTLAKQLANTLGYIYVDTGAMYRAVALYAMEHDYITNDLIDEKLIKEDLDQIQIEFIFNPDLGFSEIYLNKKNVEREIRKIDVSNKVSMIAKISAVRKKMVAQQHIMGIHKGIVMDGRDIGTVVFPDAELKIFMTASPHIRAKRRYDEMIEKGDDVTYQSVLENVETRDFIDTTRKDSPLVKAKDAVEVNSDELNVEETYKLVLDIAKKKIQYLS